MTPGQYHIIWIIKYPFTPHPRQKLERHSYNQPTSVQPSFNVFKNNLDTVFIHYRLIVPAAAVFSQSEGDEGGGGRWGSWYMGGGVGWGLPWLSCSAECVKAQVWITAVQAGVTPSGLLWCLVHCSPHREGTGFCVLTLCLHLVSGLVKEDVARLRVLGDFRSETVEFFYGLRVNFLQEQKKHGRVRKNGNTGKR